MANVSFINFLEKISKFLKQKWKRKIIFKLVTKILIIFLMEKISFGSVNMDKKVE